jgi:hypothetical protein
LSCCQIPLAILLIFAGIFGFLPVPGLWMLRSDSFCSRRDPAFSKGRWRGCPDGLSANGSGVSAQKACNDSIKRLPESILSIFRLCCGARCDSKANVAD